MAGRLWRHRGNTSDSSLRAACRECFEPIGLSWRIGWATVTAQRFVVLYRISLLAGLMNITNGHPAHAQHVLIDQPAVLSTNSQGFQHPGQDKSDLLQYMSHVGDLAANLSTLPKIVYECKV